MSISGCAQVQAYEANMVLFGRIAGEEEDHRPAWTASVERGALAEWIRWLQDPLDDGFVLRARCSGSVGDPASGGTVLCEVELSGWGAGLTLRGIPDAGPEYLLATDLGQTFLNELCRELRKLQDGRS